MEEPIYSLLVWLGVDSMFETYIKLVVNLRDIPQVRQRISVDFIIFENKQNRFCSFPQVERLIFSLDLV